MDKILTFNLKQLPQLRDYIFYNLFGGPKLIKAAHLANFFKATTFFYTLLLMHIYNNFSLGSYLYLSIHGSYGFLWLIKDLTFPDKSF